MPAANRDEKLATKARQQAKNKDDYVASSAAPALPTVPGMPATPPASPYANQSLTPDTDKLSFARMANALLPFFSSQDQQSVSTFLNTQDPTGMFKDYLGQAYTPNAQTTETGQYFSSAQRAKDALAKLDTMRTAAGLTEEQLGSGYKFLKQAIGILANLGAGAGEQGMTRAEYENLQAQLEALNSQAKSDQTLAPYAELATKFINPTLIGTLFPTSTSGGHTIYGQASKKLFT